MQDRQATDASPGCFAPGSTGVDRHEIGRRLGFDLHTHGRTPGEAGWPADVEEGWRHARIGRRRAHPADRHERKWLQLRLQAHRRDRIFDAAITPEWLRRIDVGHCPVTRRPLTHALREPTDWSIDRVNNDGAYAPANLAVMSTLVNQAKGNRGFDAVLALARADAGTDGLQPVEWLRLAGLMVGPCFATRPAQAPTLPLVALVPRGLALTAMQQTQHVFAQQGATSRGKNLLIKRFGLACRTEAAHQRLARLAETVHAAARGLEHSCDVWLHPAAMAALERWREALDAAAWGLAGEVGRVLAGANRIDAARLAAWQLATRGYRPA